VLACNREIHCISSIHAASTLVACDRSYFALSFDTSLAPTCSRFSAAKPKATNRPNSSRGLAH
jgi:hypothetical protein